MDVTFQKSLSFLLFCKDKAFCLVSLITFFLLLLIEHQQLAILIILAMQYPHSFNADFGMTVYGGYHVAGYA